MPHLSRLFVTCALFVSTTVTASEIAGKPDGAELVVVDAGKSAAKIVVSPTAGDWEKRAASDLAKYVQQMSGAAVEIVSAADAVAAAMEEKAAPVLFVGQAALVANPSLKDALAKSAKQNPVLRSDAIVVRRAGNRVYLAGNNDDAHYYAVIELLNRWGCWWFMPTEFGECVPRQPTLKVGQLDHAYGPPFEARGFWLAWNGDRTGHEEFLRRNFMNKVKVPSGHSLGKHVKELIPPGKTAFNVPISEEATAQHVAKKVAPTFAKGQHVMLGLDDGVYISDSPKDKELMALQYDKYFMTPSYTDAFLTFYNRVAELLREQHPESKSKIGFLIYANITMPPVRVTEAKEPLVGYLAPIDFDPIHGMDSPLSANAREYKDLFYKWAKVMGGRMVIYDYDQSMLVWRDLPNPSHAMFRENVKHYAKAGILGIDTESRGAMATVFTNLYLRGQLMWNPQLDVDAALADFYLRFYGPAAGPMAKYWGAIFQAWEQTIVSEHEYFVAPAVYTPELLKELRTQLDAAYALSQTAASGPAHRTYGDRLRFTRLGFEVMDAYMAMVRSATTDCDYKAAAAHGERGLAAREQLTQMNGTFTTYKKIGERGYAWWPGEVKQYAELAPLTDGTKGTLVAKLPLEWAFRRDPADVGVKENWAKLSPDLAKWEKSAATTPEWKRRNAVAGDWEVVRSDLYLQAQGILDKDMGSYTGHGWYHVPVDLTAEQTGGDVRLKFPGLFNECWLYVNGEQVAHREFKGLWWRNDYRFEWEVKLEGKLKPGKNTVVLRIHNPHHMGGMFRRPFLYRAAAQ